MRGETVWQDLRLPAIDNSQPSDRSWLSIEPNSIQEAENWRINSQGKVELIAQKSFPWLTNQFNCPTIRGRS